MNWTSDAVCCTEQKAAVIAQGIHTQSKSRTQAKHITPLPFTLMLGGKAEAAAGHGCTPREWGSCIFCQRRRSRPSLNPLNPADAPAEEVAKFSQDTDLKRAAQPEELSPAYVFLAAPSCASYITGIVLPVTGHIEAI
jgi:hypothetical protein